MCSERCSNTKLLYLLTLHIFLRLNCCLLQTAFMSDCQKFELKYGAGVLLYYCSVLIQKVFIHLFIDLTTFLHTLSGTTLRSHVRSAWMLTTVVDLEKLTSLLEVEWN